MKRIYNINDEAGKKENLHDPASVYQAEEPLAEDAACLKRIKKPDEDFYRAVSMEEFAAAAKTHIRELYKHDKK
ncbi:hypothetical protein M2480_002240 [Parabacteroides sp. PFB2-12]|uniref:hypothetical protein n=1 Tax=unclassified Parabacteroides TaxID=2649774 RepID=UPI0024740DF1|nr:MULTISPECIES: hypothetical protein [unclassified Parabacteroides]MDH6343887.1 hypothetical protein [Parabacteroides sp. PM6-13]MDH6391249.1 hypothetical protein [Parabacteroides sp. PFB2-12]MDL2310010.1 hypothetical protein [Parabacteroides sp. OttesenSCG-928-B22]